MRADQSCSHWERLEATVERESDGEGARVYVCDWVIYGPHFLKLPLSLSFSLSLSLEKIRSSEEVLAPSAFEKFWLN